MDIRVKLSPVDTVNLLEEHIIRGALSAEQVDKYQAGDFYVLVFDKYFMRVSSRASLTVVVHPDGNGVSAVHSVGSGGGTGVLFGSFDWGAGGSFEGSVEKALESYIV